MWGGVWAWSREGCPGRAGPGCRGASCRPVSIDLLTRLGAPVPQLHSSIRSDERKPGVRGPGPEMAADLFP